MKELQDALERFSNKADELAAMSRRGNHGNTATFNVDTGGAAIWIAATCCLVMFGMNVVLAAVLVMHDRKIDDMTHYLNAIYMQAPHLKPNEA